MITGARLAGAREFDSRRSCTPSDEIRMPGTDGVSDSVPLLACARSPRAI